MSKNREERVLLICDEAYLMIDQKVPQSLVYLRNVMKRARKYEGALAIISHSIVDFLSESIKQYGQALHALFLVGAKRLHIHFEIPDYKMPYMGKAGGR